VELLAEQAGNAAEKFCRKFKKGAVPWSPRLQLLRDTIAFWNAVVKKSSGRQVSSGVLKRLASKIGWNASTSLPTNIAQNHRIKALKNYYNEKRNGQTYRQTFLEGLAERIARQEGSTKEKILKQIRNREKIKQQFSRIRRILGKVNDCKLRSVIAPDAGGQPTEYSLRDDVEGACIEEACRRFTQSKRTPFYATTLRRTFGPVYNATNVNAVMQGTFVAPLGTNLATKLLLQQLKQTPAVRLSQDAGSDIPYLQFWKLWRKSRENTTSSPFGP